jgi:DNA adenine methylase
MAAPALRSPAALTGPPADGPPVRPFLKWAGGKRQILPYIREFYPEAFAGYREPFLGSGAVFFDLVNQGRLAGRRVTLTDTNGDLVGCYTHVRDEPETVIKCLKRLAARYKRDPQGHYYLVRDKFNPARQAISNGHGVESSRYTADLAAMLVYLNRTGFNGLFRLNSKGLFNVPRGRYSNPRICDAENLRNVAAVLSAKTISIKQMRYVNALAGAREGDFVYLDPPYAPLSATAQFTSYTADGFSAADQRQLQRTVIRLARKGCWVLLSNSTAPEVADLYDGNRDAERAGLHAHKRPARRMINSNASRRGQVFEYLITNIARRVS